LGKKFTNSINKLPNSITHLSLPNGIRNISDTLPPKLEHLRLSKQDNYLPPLPSTLTRLSITTVENSKVSYIHGDGFPTSLVSLIWSGPGQISLSQLSPRMEVISIWPGFIAVHDLNPFIHLNTLWFPDDFNQPIDGKLPPQLQMVLHFFFFFFGTNFLDNQIYIYIMQL
jgi:hypothetical protein